MADQLKGNGDLLAALARVTRTVERHRGRGLTEQDTKNALIEPVLGALGWPKDNLDLVRSEYRHTSKYSPVDYALLAGGRPVMLVEAKALDVSVSDHKVVAQVVSYAATMGVEWALVTNGADWHLYSALAQLDASRKKVFAVSVEEAEAADWLPWIAPERLSGNVLGNLWLLVHAERQVRDVVQRLFAERNDAFVSLIASEAHLAPAAVAQALQLLEPTVRPAGMDALCRLMGAGVGAESGRLVAGPLVVASPRQRQSSRTKQKVLPTERLRTVDVASPHESGLVAAAASSATLDGAAFDSGSSTSVSPFTVRPTPGSKPTRVTIHAASWPVATWGDALIRVVEHFSAQSPARYAEVFVAPEFQGRISRRFQTSRDGLRSPRSIPGGFAEMNLSARAIVDTVAALLSFFGVTQDAACYVVRAE